MIKDLSSTMPAGTGQRPRVMAVSRIPEILSRRGCCGRTAWQP